MSNSLLRSRYFEIMTHDYLRSLLESNHGKFLCKYTITSLFDT